MSERFDAIVVGTGFGGAVSACRLAAKNTLDFNYVAAAEAKGAQVRPVPRPTGRNPSMTIGALAERSADLMTRDGNA